MFAPIRAVVAARPEASPGVLGAAASVAVVFAATPFVIPAVTAAYPISLGTAGLLSAAQVTGFAAASFAAGRLLVATRTMLAMSVALLAAANLASAADVSYPTLLAIRFGAGAAMGVVVWIAWADAGRFVRGLGDVAAVGPLAAAVSSPVLGAVAGWGGHRAVYLTLAVTTAAALLVPARVVATPPIGRAVSPSRSNRVLLVALAVLTLASSAMFVFGAAAGVRAGIPFTVASLVFSLNALTGIAAARTGARPGRAGWWLAVTAVSAAAIGILASAPVFVVAMALWGFGFWMAVPEVFRLLAERAHRADERVGDAQSMMAIGRLLGPAVGGVVLGNGRFTLLGVIAGLGIMASATTVGMVERRRAAGARRG